MTTEIGVWNQIIGNLKNRLPKMEFDTWFHQTSLKSLDSHSAVVEVPNKFIANWFRDNYLKDLKISFKEILKETPDIVFIYTKNQKKQGLSKAKQGKKPNLYSVTGLPFPQPMRCLKGLEISIILFLFSAVQVWVKLIFFIQ